jgi:hypothetical protein
MVPVYSGTRPRRPRVALAEPRQRYAVRPRLDEFEGSVEMPRQKIDGETKDAASKRDDELVSRAAKRTDWAGSALEGAAEDLDDVGEDDSTLTGLAENVQDEAARVARLAKDIERHRADSDGTEPADRA